MGIHRRICVGTRFRFVVKLCVAGDQVPIEERGDDEADEYIMRLRRDKRTLVNQKLIHHFSQPRIVHRRYSSQRQ